MPDYSHMIHSPHFSGDVDFTAADSVDFTATPVAGLPASRQQINLALEPGPVAASAQTVEVPIFAAGTIIEFNVSYLNPLTAAMGVELIKYGPISLQTFTVQAGQRGARFKGLSHAVADGEALAIRTPATVDPAAEDLAVWVLVEY